MVPDRQPEMALMKLCRQLAMLAQMLLRQENMAPIAAASSFLCVEGGLSCG